MLPGLGSVITLPFLDWTDMFLCSAKMTPIQHGSLAETIRLDGCNSLGLVLLPTFTCRKGLLYKQKSEAQAAIAQHGVFIDRSICLHFAEQVDCRVERPLLTKGTLVLPEADCKNNKGLKTVAKSPVFCLGAPLRTKD